MAKILLVEDEVNIASFIERGLQEFGHTVSVAYNGADGWQMAQDEPFDLLVLDIIMPKMNGLDLGSTANSMDTIPPSLCLRPWVQQMIL